MVSSSISQKFLNITNQHCRPRRHPQAHRQGQPGPPEAGRGAEGDQGGDDAHQRGQAQDGGPAGHV